MKLALIWFACLVSLALVGVRKVPLSTDVNPTTESEGDVRKKRPISVN